MKNIRKKLSILLSIIIIMFFPSLSICKDNKNNLYENENDISYEQWNEYWQLNKELPIHMCISPGNDQTIINFSWYSKEKDLSSKLKFYYGNEEKNINVKSVYIGNGFVSNKAEVKNLKPNTTYFYSYTIDNKWMNPVAYKTKDSNKFSFVFMGDPQIGASYKYKNLSSYEKGIELDAYNWNKVIKKTLDKREDCSFILCAGDETNTKNDYSDKDKEIINQMEYCGFLCPNYLRNIPIVNTVGNHDEKNIDFYYHFNMPNQSYLGSTKAGGDYYFNYNNALFLVLNTNNLNFDEHVKFIANAIDKSDAKWKIVVFHHDIYGGGTHSEDEDVQLIREKLPYILEENNIDLVLNGHDHIYSRANILRDNVIINNSKGITYITGGSSTGSKFYKKTYNDEDYISVKFQEEIPIYTIIDISEDNITINSFRIDDEKEIDTIKINKVSYLNKGFFYNKESFIFVVYTYNILYNNI